MDRRTFLLSAAAPFAASALQNTRKRNVLFISTDDLNNCIGAFGHPIVKTPNIDRIAKNGLRFDRAYCQFPLCSPSRTSLMTGLAPDTTKVYELQTHFRKVLPEVMTLAQAFQKNGYFSGRVGKIYHYGNPGQIGTDGLDDKPSWNQAVNPAGVDKLEEEPKLTNYTPARGLGSAVAFYASPKPDEDHTDGKVAAEVIKMLEANKERPFFIGAGFYKPHVPWIAPKKYFDMYPLEEMDVRPFDPKEMTIAPEPAYATRPANLDMTVEQRRDAIRAYYATISFVDAQIGKVLDALERLKLADNTTVVFWSDHGYQLGEHGQWMKQTVFEWSAKTPLIIAGAGVPSRGKSSTRTVELLDLYPTLNELCGLSGTPSNLHGASLVPLLRNPNASWSKPAISQVRRGQAEKFIHGHSLRNERYRYTMWKDGDLGEELYDYEADPHEMRNLAPEERHDSVKARLKAQLQKVLRERGKA